MATISRSAQRNENTFFGFFLLLLLSITLTVLPVPVSMQWIWPKWILVLVLYHILTNPNRYGIIFGFSLGILVDVLVSTKLGVHALSYTIICYLVAKMQSRFYLFPVTQQALLISFFVLVDFVSVFIFTSIELDWVFIGNSLLTAAATAICWITLMLFYGYKLRTSRM